jgi:hypothetical protein
MTCVRICLLDYAAGGAMIFCSGYGGIGLRYAT